VFSKGQGHRARQLNTKHFSRRTFHEYRDGNSVELAMRFSFSSNLRRILGLDAWVLLGATAVFEARGGQFENLGTPVKATMIAASAAGVNEKGEDVLYFSCAQPGNHQFLLQVNPATDAARQLEAPVGEGA
jgi:hypothetical protein